MLLQPAKVCPFNRNDAAAMCCMTHGVARARFQSLSIVFAEGVARCLRLYFARLFAEHGHGKNIPFRQRTGIAGIPRQPTLARRQGQP